MIFYNLQYPNYFHPAMMDSIFSIECMCLVNVLAAMVWMHHSTLTLLDVHLLYVSCQPLQTGEGSYGLPHPGTSSPLTLELQFWNECKPDELCETTDKTAKRCTNATLVDLHLHRQLNQNVFISILLFKLVMGWFIILLIHNWINNWFNSNFWKMLATSPTYL